jgi:hypothetical protein
MQVILHGFLTDAEASCHLPVGKTLGHQVENLPLSFSQWRPTIHQLGALESLFDRSRSKECANGVCHLGGNLPPVACASTWAASVPAPTDDQDPRLPKQM